MYHVRDPTIYIESKTQIMYTIYENTVHTRAEEGTWIRDRKSH